MYRPSFLSVTATEEVEFVTLFARALRISYPKRKPATPKHDPVIRSILRLLGELKKESVERFAMDLQVKPTTASMPLTASLVDNPGIKFYDFFSKGPIHLDSFPRTVPITLNADADFHSPHSGHIMVRSSAAWVPIESWIRSLPPSPLVAHNLRFDSLKLQQGWWAALRRPFRLLDLPLELRMCVFESVIGPIYPEVRANFSGSSKRVVVMREYPDCIPTDHTRGRFSIFAVSKQVRQEALKAGWEGIVKIFTNPDSLLSVTIYRNTLNFNVLNRIQLLMPHWQYFELFGIQVNTTGALSDGLFNTFPRVFREMQNLRYLEIRFPNPRLWEDPWRYPYRGVTIGRREAISSCSKVTSEWILAFAKKHIQHIPTITLTGCIKHSVRVKWTEIFKDERRGIQVDMSDYVKKILATPPALLPPRCSCTVSCYDRPYFSNHNFNFED